jgi:hypothetical protein
MRISDNQPAITAAAAPTASSLHARGCSFPARSIDKARPAGSPSARRCVHNHPWEEGSQRAPQAASIRISAPKRPFWRRGRRGGFSDAKNHWRAPTFYVTPEILPNGLAGRVEKRKFQLLRTQRGAQRV